jgi:site-specific recombinase XerD
MLLPLKPICPASKIRKCGTSLIFLQYCKSESEKTLLNTEIAIPPKFWHKKLKRIQDTLPKEYGDAKSLNEEVYRMYIVAEKIIQFALINKTPDPVAFVKKTFTPKFDVSSLADLKQKDSDPINLDFFFQFEDYISSKKNKITPGMLKVFNNTKGVLKCFETFREKEIKFDEIDFNFYEELVDYLLFDHVHRRRKELVKGLKLSSAGKIIKQLRIFLKNRMRKKIISEIDLEDFKILDEESDAIYLTNEEIRKINQADLSEHPFLEKYRALLVFGCLTGLRFSDFSTIKPEDVRDKRLYKKQKKSDSWVVVPLRDEAYSIFIQRFKRIIPIVSNPDFNYYIKEVGRLAGITASITFSHKKGNNDIIQTKPKHQWITSHTCRRSFCTNEFLAGTPVELIMKISGHKSIRDFYRYIRISPEQAAIQIEKIWSSRRTNSET